MNQVLSELQKADIILVVGTSALVQPAASFPLLVKKHGGQIIEVNVEATPLTISADVHLKGKAGELLPQIDNLL